MRLESNGRKSCKKTAVLTDLEEATTKFREAEIVHRHSDPLYLSDMGSEESPTPADSRKEIPISYQGE